jgi:hypothetical protein
LARLAREIPLPQVVLPHLLVSALKRKEVEQLSAIFG